MGKVLRVSLAMGGGVSLGTFSGAALTEALKLLLLFGKDQDGQSYDKVELDAMSGASAGAISLAIMVRAMIHHESLFPVLETSRKEVIARLNEAYSKAKIDSLSTEKLNDLVALEVAQIFQHFIWVKKITINGLFEEKISEDYEPGLNEGFSLLGRKKILQVVGDNVLHGLEKINPEEVRVLSSRRFLVANSLANLLPIPSKLIRKYNDKFSDQEVKAHDLELVFNLQQSTASYIHNELRVFDFVLDPKIDSYKKWIRFGLKGNNHGNLKEKDTWDTFITTSVACGAFPLAFEPTFLKRYKSEYDDAWPLDDGVDSIKFPYIDGGTFNNEPIKEAFRLANYIDRWHEHKSNNYSNPHNEKKSHERLVLFVDPAVPDRDPSYFMKANAASKLKNIEYRDLQFIQNNEFNKLFITASKIIGSLARQGSIKEEHKVDGYIENLNLLKPLTDYIINSNLQINETAELVERCIHKLGATLNKNFIPIAPCNDAEYLFHFFKNLSKKHKKVFANISRLNSDEFEKFLKDHYVDFEEGNDLSFSNVTINLRIKSEDITHQEFLKGIFILLGELSLNSTGKDSEAIRAAITPHNLGTFKTKKLRGSELLAFGGFASENARDIAFCEGKISALSSLRSSCWRFYYKKLLKKDIHNLPFIEGVNEVLSVYEAELRKISLKESWKTYTELLIEKIKINSASRIKSILRKILFQKAPKGIREYLIKKASKLIVNSIQRMPILKKERIYETLSPVSLDPINFHVTSLVRIEYIKVDLHGSANHFNIKPFLRKNKYGFDHYFTLFYGDSPKGPSFFLNGKFISEEEKTSERIETFSFHESAYNHKLKDMSMFNLIRPQLLNLEKFVNPTITIEEPFSADIRVKFEDKTSLITLINRKV